MAELVAGPELDLAVAEAAGIEGWIESLKNVVTGHESRPRFTRSDTDCFWEPSKDLNAAFEAAEKVGLFESGVVQMFLSTDGYSPMQWTIADRDGGDLLGFAPTPALAICAAILKLKGAD